MVNRGHICSPGIKIVPLNFNDNSPPSEIDETPIKLTKCKSVLLAPSNYENNDLEAAPVEGEISLLEQLPKPIKKINRKNKSVSFSQE